jgi:hypothetical protein
LSGPIQLPKKVFGPAGYDGRDKTFFFFSYEGQRFLLPQGAVTTVVPSLAARRGRNVYSQRASFPPLPNGADMVSKRALTGAPHFIAAYSEPSSSDATSVRIDHNFNQSFSIFGRYNNAPSRQLSRSRGALASSTA